MTTSYGFSYWPVFITDAKRKDPPASDASSPKATGLPEHLRTNTVDAETLARRAAVRRESQPQPNPAEQMREALKAGVQVVSAPQLFPTPPEIAERMVEDAGIEAGHRVLEPSAGTGNLVSAIHAHNLSNGTTSDIQAVEINGKLAHLLRFNDGLAPNRVHEGDFLEQNGNLGTFDRIVMNPPFGNAQDIKHIQHAVHFLKPGGRLVALCAAGPRQEAELRPLAENSGGTWEVLPAGSFKEAGTNVNVALLTIEA